MSEQTGISWTDSTFNYWMGCTKVSPACDHCYAERDMDTRLGKVKWGAGQQRVRTGEKNRNLPLRWNRQQFAECLDPECGWRGVPKNDINGIPECPRCEESCCLDFTARRRVFSSSLSDWLDNEVPIEWLVGLLDIIRQTPNLDWLLLSKRIGNWRARLQAAMEATSPAATHKELPLHGWIERWLAGFAPPNVWIGATMENQPVLNRDWEKLQRVPAAIRFISVEPMLGPIDPTRVMRQGGGNPDVDDVWTYCDNALTGFRAHKCGGTTSAKLDLVIIGGESGSNARSMNLAWVLHLVRLCVSAGTAVHVKQLGAKPVCGDTPWKISDRAGHILSEWPEELRVQEFPRSAA